MFQLRWVWANMKGYRKLFICGLLCTLTCSFSVLINPMISQQLVDKVVIGETAADGTVTRAMNLLIPLCVAMILCTFIRSSLNYLSKVCYEISSQGTVHKIRNYLYQNLQKQDMNFYDKNRTGDLMTRVTGDLDMVRHCIAYVLWMLLDSLAMFVFAIVYFLTIDVWMTLCLVVLTPIIFAITKVYSSKVRPLYINLREKMSDLNTAAQENISGNRVVKAFAQEQFEMDKFDRKNDDFRVANKEPSYMWLRYYPYLETVAQSLSVVTLLVGGIFMIQGRITPGEFTVFNGMTWTLSNPMRQLGMLLSDLQRFFASASKIIEIYYARPTIVNRHDCVQPKKEYDGKVEFQHVTLKFGKATILEDVNFTANPGETIAIMGSTGSGKTSLINLIPRFYDASDGKILVDDVDVRMRPLEDLRGHIGMATQDVFLFSDTVEGNICYGDTEMPEEQIQEYAVLAAADDFIQKMPDGYDTIIGERGVGLSGGQKQRIALARALAIRPNILILDDTTSAVDMETEKYIQHSLDTLNFKCTKFIIAQRISSTRHADKIIILQDGKIAQMGTHEELVKQDGYYREIFCLQNEGAEMAGVN